MHRLPAIPARLAACLSVLLVAGIMFAGWLHPRVVDPTNIGWLLDGEDRGQNAAGLTAYLRAPPAWPSNSATIWTVLGNSSWATAATEPLSIGSGASERVVPPERPSSSRPEPERRSGPQARRGCENDSPHARSRRVVSASHSSV